MYITLGDNTVIVLRLSLEIYMGKATLVWQGFDLYQPFPLNTKFEPRRQKTGLRGLTTKVPHKPGWDNYTVISIAFRDLKFRI